MTTRAEMAELAAAAEAVIAGLIAAGAIQSASRLQRCMKERRQRQKGVRPWTCRSPACPWCLRPLLTRWDAALAAWIGKSTATTIVLVPLDNSMDLHLSVRRLRRQWRDLRDREARRIGQRCWRRVAAAGLANIGGAVRLHVRHDGLTRSELMRVIHRRWPAAVVVERSMVKLGYGWPPKALIGLGLLKRGVEPMRVLVPPQRAVTSIDHLDDVKPDPAGCLPMPVLLPTLHRAHSGFSSPAF